MIMNTFLYGESKVANWLKVCSTNLLHKRNYGDCQLASTFNTARHTALYTHKSQRFPVATKRCNTSGLSTFAAPGISALKVCLASLRAVLPLPSGLSVEFIWQVCCLKTITQ